MPKKQSSNGNNGGEQDHTLNAADSSERDDRLNLKVGGEIQRNRVIYKQNGMQWSDLQSAFKKRIKSGVITNLSHIDISPFMNDSCILFEKKLKLFLNEHEALKINAELACEYVIEKDDTDEVEDKYFNTENAAIYKTTDLLEWFNENIKEPIRRDIEELETKDSGWRLQEISYLTININHLNPIRGSSYIKLPPQIENKHTCINVKNKDNECFKWAVLSGLHPQKDHAYNVDLYKPFRYT